MKKHARTKLALARETLRTLDSDILFGAAGGRINLSRVSQCPGDDPCVPPPASTHCITD
jgi:hypothetical protein